LTEPFGDPIIIGKSPFLADGGEKKRKRRAAEELWASLSGLVGRFLLLRYEQRGGGREEKKRKRETTHERRGVHERDKIGPILHNSFGERKG